jgi:hypothetical protein
LTWTDALPGTSTTPIRALASYYTTSLDGGLTWQPAERLAEGQHGAWEAAAVAVAAAVGTLPGLIENAVYANCDNGGEGC